MIAGTTTRILVVEDEQLIRWDLSMRLEDEGYQTVQAANADEAIAILEKDREIQIIFTDVQMPGTMDGVELARYVRKRWPPTIIVVSSARHHSELTGLPEGIDLFPKPYDPKKWPDLMSSLDHKLSRLNPE